MGYFDGVIICHHRLPLLEQIDHNLKFLYMTAWGRNRKRKNRNKGGAAINVSMQSTTTSNGGTTMFVSEMDA